MAVKRYIVESKNKIVKYDEKVVELIVYIDRLDGNISTFISNSDQIVSGVTLQIGEGFISDDHFYESGSNLYLDNVINANEFYIEPETGQLVYTGT